jgi:hypothetical protein
LFKGALRVAVTRLPDSLIAVMLEVGVGKLTADRGPNPVEIVDWTAGLNDETASRPPWTLPAFATNNLELLGRMAA